MSSTMIDYTPEQETQSVPLSKEPLQVINSPASIKTSHNDEDTVGMEMADPLLTATSSSSSSDIDPEEHIETASTTATEASSSSFDHHTAEPSTSSASFSFANDGQAKVDEDEEPQRPLSRPLSRQELRRKSSFFNNKDIVVNSQRYSATTYSSLRPVADPRFKNRFQSILSQWKARDSN